MLPIIAKEGKKEALDVLKRVAAGKAPRLVTIEMVYPNKDKKRPVQLELF
jgi:hypothetical protein